jgi:hypothetical protein
MSASDMGGGPQFHQGVEAARLARLSDACRQMLQKLPPRRDRQVQDLVADGNADMRLVAGTRASEDAERQVLDREVRSGRRR